jgi:flap endonuclease-1
MTSRRREGGVGSMGVQLTDLVSGTPIEFPALARKRIAIDAMNSLYQFLSIIRQPTGEPLSDSHGRVTSHLSGLFYRTLNLLEYGIQPLYVFDGEPPSLKEGVVEERREVRKRAGERWRTALAEGRIQEAKVYAMQSSRFTSEMLQDARELIGLLGIPQIQAPSEGEAQAAYMTARGDVWAAGSQDYDSLLFGAPRLIRNLTISGRRKIPRQERYVEVRPELLELEKVLQELGVTREELVDLSILIGTDFNPKGVEGIGPKKAHVLIREYGTAERALEAKGVPYDFPLEEIREIFLRPPVLEEYELIWKPPDREGLLRFLCDKRDFSPERVGRALERLEKSPFRSQASLDSWFG